MVRCPDCGREVPRKTFCNNCGAYLPKVEESVNTDEVNAIGEFRGEAIGLNISGGAYHPTIADNNSHGGYCHNCGFKYKGNLKFCPHCGCNLRIPSVNGSVELPVKKSMLSAVILSAIFPGLGQFYLDLNQKGIIFLIAQIISILLILFTIGIILCIIIWIWALIDTVNSTNAINRGEKVEDKLL